MKRERSPHVESEVANKKWKYTVPGELVFVDGDWRKLKKRKYGKVKIGWRWRKVDSEQIVRTWVPTWR